MAASSFSVNISKIRDGVPEAMADYVAVEEPLEIRLGYSTPDGRATRSVSITMRTPGNDRELAAGFLYTEAIIRRPEDIASIETCGPPAPDSGNHNVIRVDLRPDVTVDLGKLQRHFYTTSSCGVCGKTSLDAIRVALAEPFKDVDTRFSRAVLTTIPDALRQAQHTFEETGGLHAAAAFNSKGDLLVTMEDVGRHNAYQGSRDDHRPGSLFLLPIVGRMPIGDGSSGRSISRGACLRRRRSGSRSPH